MSLSSSASSELVSTKQPHPVSASAEMTDVAEVIRVRGIVQGVGFRPTVYQLARQCHLRGTVCNDGQGVLIQVAGTRAAIEEFIRRLQAEKPPLAKIEAIARQPLSQVTLPDTFIILPSIHNTVHTSISPDAATCPQCLADTLDPYSRWYRYPFTNCTHCGPRLSIIRSIPYDRANTSMASFVLCPECRQNYEDVSDRRFHAQPVACHRCGPRAWLQRADGRPIVADMFSMMDDVDAACTLLQRGEIVAIKGIGGIHLACDATQEAAVQKLRQKKHRYHKPFALMARDLAIVEQYCWVSQLEKNLLESSAAPIVLLQRKEVNPGLPAIAPAVAPDTTTLGFLLPYTPLHHLLLRRMQRPIVLTSGNLSDEPQCIDNQEALTKLGSIADYFLLHNREIVNRVDDSVVKVALGQPQVLRRARGYAPAPLRLPQGFEQAPSILAMGGELKNTFCLIRQGEAILSQHLGDLEHAAAFAAYHNTLELYLHLFEHRPDAIALDLHPEYLSTKLGKDLAAAIAPDAARAVHEIQHHHAHVAACMAENALPIDTTPVLGIALDGLGFGDDGTLWGGEFLLADYRRYQRLARFKPVALIGGVQAIRQPWRNTYAHLIAAFDWADLERQYLSLDLIQFLQKQPRALLDQLLEKHIHAPLASSCGRLFDAVAAAVGLCRESVSYEGQGAIALETAATQFLHTMSDMGHAYPFLIDRTTPDLLSLDPHPLWQNLLQDLHQGLAPGEIAAKFHLGLAEAIAHLVRLLRQHHEFHQVALTGGVFQNQLLLEQVYQRLIQAGLTVLVHRQVPSNDGGLSLGQGAIAAARLLATPS